MLANVQENAPQKSGLGVRHIGKYFEQIGQKLILVGWLGGH
jgi:hypothetical protein